MIDTGFGIRALAAKAIPVAVAALAAVACGSGSSSVAGSATPTPTPTKSALIAKANACTLVTATDASSATGVTVTSLLAAGAVPGACFYSSSDGTTSVIVFAQVYADSSTANGIAPGQMAAALNSAYGVGNAKSVSGIGDKALEYSVTGSGSNGTVIFVYKSNVVIMIIVTPSATSTAVETMAKLAVGRL